MRAFVFALTALAVCFTGSNAAAQDGRWLRAETEGFIVYSAAPDRSTRALATELEVFDALLRRMTDAPAERSPTKLEVFLYSESEFRETFPRARDSIAGFYTARVDQIAAFAIYRDGGFSGQDILFHEYAHHFMFQHFANAYPAWYVEGFAEFMSTAQLGTERIVLGRSNEGRFYALRNESWMSIERMITVSPHELDSREATLFYAQSWLMTHYLVLTPGKMAQFQAYVRALRLGEEPVAAFQTGFGVTPAAFLSELRRYYRSSPNALALNRPAQVDLSGSRITRLPASADALLPLYARIRLGVDEADESAVLTRVRTLTEGRTDRFSALTRGYAEARFGETAQARAVLAPLLASDPDDVEALHLTGLSYLNEADEADGEQQSALRGQARRHFGRAYQRNANHVPSLYRYAQSFQGTMMDDAAMENYLNVLMLANQLAPQIDEISINASYALMARGRYAEAIPMLRAVAFDPHGGSSAETARDMLAEAEAGLARTTGQ